MGDESWVLASGAAEQRMRDRRGGGGAGAGRGVRGVQNGGWEAAHSGAK